MNFYTIIKSIILLFKVFFLLTCNTNNFVANIKLVSNVTIDEFFTKKNYDDRMTIS